MTTTFNKTVALAPFLLVALAPLATGCGSTGSTPSSAQTNDLASATSTTSGTKVVSTELASGLYQLAYSAKYDVLWTTSAVGRPPIKSSALIKVDPHTRKIEASYTPPVLDETTGALEAVYGVAVDDAHDHVWVTNTRNDSIAVYSELTGEHIATLSGVDHARELVIDEKNGVAWASSFTGGALVAFDTVTLKEKARIAVDGSGPTGLAVNPQTGTVYAADLTKNQIIEVAAGSTTPRLIPTTGGPISIELSADGSTAYTADQTSGTVSFVDLASGKVTKSIPTGAGALAVAVDHTTGKIVVVNRTAATASVIDPLAGTVTETIPTKANPNHVIFTGSAAYIVDKSGGGTGLDSLYNLTFNK